MDVFVYIHDTSNLEAKLNATFRNPHIFHISTYRHSTIFSSRTFGQPVIYLQVKSLPPPSKLPTIRSSNLLIFTPNLNLPRDLDAVREIIRRWLMTMTTITKVHHCIPIHIYAPARALRCQRALTLRNACVPPWEGA